MIGKVDQEGMTVDESVPFNIINQGGVIVDEADDDREGGGHRSRRQRELI